MIVNGLEAVIVNLTFRCITHLS